MSSVIFGMANGTAHNYNQSVRVGVSRDRIVRDQLFRSPFMVNLAFRNTESVHQLINDIIIII